jgi:hypothetical protein
MDGTKPPESGSESPPHSIPQHAGEWIRQFVQQLELHFLDTTQNLASEAGFFDYQVATIRAVLRTLLDSGMDTESIVGTIGQVLIERRPGPLEWTPELNQRRFDLIDREIQETLTPAERIELAGLTRIMREAIDTEANLPMEGAKILHRKLTESKATHGSP